MVVGVVVAKFWGGFGFFAYFPKSNGDHPVFLLKQPTPLLDELFTYDNSRIYHSAYIIKRSGTMLPFTILKCVTKHDRI